MSLTAVRLDPAGTSRLGLFRSMTNYYTPPGKTAADLSFAMKVMNVMTFALFPTSTTIETTHAEHSVMGTDETTDASVTTFLRI